MKQFKQLTIKQVEKEIIAWETEMGREAKTVDVIHIELHPEEDMYQQGDGSWCESLYAKVVIDGKKIRKCYEWNCDYEEIDAESVEDEEEGR